MKKILYVDMDSVLVDFEKAIPLLPPETRAIYEGRLDEIPGFFSQMLPVEGALEAYRKLSSLFDTYILSTAPWNNPSAWSDKLLWVQKYLENEAYKRLIISHHKDLNRGDFLIDDRLKNGADGFKGEHLHFGTEKFPDWNSVLAYLIPKA